MMSARTVSTPPIAYSTSERVVCLVRNGIIIAAITQRIAHIRIDQAIGLAVRGLEGSKSGGSVMLCMRDSALRRWSSMTGLLVASGWLVPYLS